MAHGSLRGIAYLVLLCLLLAWSGAAGLRQGHAQVVVEQTTLRGSLASFVAQLKDHIPRRDTQRFLPPAAGETARLVEGVRRALEEPMEAAIVLDEFGFEVQMFIEESVERPLILFRERDPCARCWGTYVFALDPSRLDLSIQVPHPLFDLFTPELATDAFLHGNAAHLFIAGAHRYANGDGSLVSDMSRNPDSFFQAMHQAFTTPTTHVVQIHGFTLENHPGYPSIVLSNSTRQPSSELRELAGAFEAAGVSTGVWDGSRWDQLAAGVTPQGRHTNSIGGRFYHLEFERAIRLDPQRRALAAQTISDFFRRI